MSVCHECGSLLGANGLPIVPDLAVVLTDIDRVSFGSYAGNRARDGLAIIAAASPAVEELEGRVAPTPVHRGQHRSQGDIAPCCRGVESMFRDSSGRSATRGGER